MAQDLVDLIVNFICVARTYLYPLRSHVVIFRDEQFSRFSTVMMCIKGTVSRDFCAQTTLTGPHMNRLIRFRRTFSFSIRDYTVRYSLTMKRCLAD